MRDDHDVVLEAVQQTWRSLAHASEDCRGNWEIAVAALMQSTDALEFIAEGLGSDRDFMLRAVQNDGLALRYAREDFREDREIVTAAFKQNNMSLRDVPESLHREVWQDSGSLLDT